MIEVDKIISKSILASFAVGCGCCVYSASASPVVGSLLYSVALLFVLKNSLNLFTFKAGFASDKYDLRRLLLVLIVNITIATLFGFIAGILSDGVRLSADAIVSARINSSYLAIALNSIIVGFLFSFAVRNETIISLLCITAAMIIGGYHSISDAFYFGASSTFIHNLGVSFFTIFVTTLFNFIGCNMYNLFTNRSFIRSGD